MTTRSVKDTYDDWASFYHRMYPTPAHGIEEARRALSVVLPEHANDRRSALDVGCGIGFSAAALAKLGYRVTGWDLSPKSLERAQALFNAMGLTAVFAEADILKPPVGDAGLPAFDVVTAFASVIAHFETVDAQRQAISNLAGLVAPGGHVVMGVYDYAALLQSEPDESVAEASIVQHPTGETVYLRRRSWTGQPRDRVHVSRFYQILDGKHLRFVETRYRAITFMEVTEILVTAGMLDIRWFQPESTGYYQSLCIARRAGVEERETASTGRRIAVHRVQRRPNARE